MNIIYNNPYRIAGILSSATTKELEKQKGKIKAYIKVGKEIKSDLDFEILGKVNRTEDSVNKAFSNIEQNQDKVNYSLFWFIEDLGLQHLKAGNEEKAVEIWEKFITNKGVNSKNFSALNNLGTYKLLSRDKTDINLGIQAKIKLIDSDYFEDFVHSVADATFTIDKQRQSKKLIDELLKQFKNQYSSSETLQLFAGCNGTTQKHLSKMLTEEPLHKIESQIESCKKKRKADKGRAYEFGLKLFTNTKDDLSLLKSLFDTNDLKYKAVADQLANEIMQCGIDYFNESRENDSVENYLESAQKLTKLADSIAVGKLAKDRAKDSLATLDEMKDRELNQAIALLSSIKVAYETACQQIDKQVEELQYQDDQFGGRIPRFNVSINWSKVEKMKKQALNWDKVVEIVSNGITINDITTIKRCSNHTKVSEYKSLVDFLFVKLGPIHINQVKHLCYWKDVRAAQAKATAKKVGSTISSATDGGCYIATMAYGDYDHPQVMKLRRFRDDFLSQTIIGRSFINLYYKYSPKLVEILKNQRGINLIIRKGLNQFIEVIKK